MVLSIDFEASQHKESVQQEEDTTCCLDRSLRGSPADNTESGTSDSSGSTTPIDHDLGDKGQTYDTSYRKRRSRTVMTPMQTRILNQVLAKTFFPSASQREHLSNMLDIPQRTIQIWFQNQRQKVKNQNECKFTTMRVQTDYRNQFSCSIYNNILSKMDPAAIRLLLTLAQKHYKITCSHQITPMMLVNLVNQYHIVGQGFCSEYLGSTEQTVKRQDSPKSDREGVYPPPLMPTLFRGMHICKHNIQDTKTACWPQGNCDSTRRFGFQNRSNICMHTPFHKESERQIPDWEHKLYADPTHKYPKDEKLDPIEESEAEGNLDVLVDVAVNKNDCMDEETKDTNEQFEKHPVRRGSTPNSEVESLNKCDFAINNKTSKNKFQGFCVL